MSETVRDRQAIYVSKIEEIPDRGRKLLTHGEVEIGVFRIGDAFFAWHNECSHRQGPVCQGRLYGEVEEPVAADGTIRTMQYKSGALNIVCPWHGYEYDLRTGINTANPLLRLRRAEIERRGDEIYVLL